MEPSDLSGLPEQARRLKLADAVQVASTLTVELAGHEQQSVDGPQ